MRIIDGSSDVCSSDLIVHDARAVLQGAQWTVALEIKGGDAIDTFNAVAAECFNATQTCPSQRLAIVLDSKVMSAPNIPQPSYERDQISISGSFTESDAKDHSLVLRYGSLTVPLEIQQTRPEIGRRECRGERVQEG